MSSDPNPVAVVVGVFLLIAGVCLILLGGGCTISILNSLGSTSSSERELGHLFLIVSIVTLAVGALMSWGGIRLLKPRDD